MCLNKHRILFQWPSKLFLFLSVCHIFGGTAQARVNIFTTLSVEEVYDNNIFLVDDKNSKSEDFITLIWPGIAATYAHKYISFGLNYSAGFEFHSRFDENNRAVSRFMPSGDLDLSYQLSKQITISIANSLNFVTAENQLLGIKPTGQSQNRTNRGNSSISGQSSYISTTTKPSDYTSNRANASVLFNMSKFLSFNAGYSHTITEYDDGAVNDSVSQDAYLETNYNFSRDISLNLRGGYKNFAFDDGTSVEDYSFQGGASYRISAALSASMQGGVTYTGNFSSPNWIGSAQINKIFKRGSIGLSYNRQVTSTVGAAGTSVTDSVTLSYAKTFTMAANGDVRISYINSSSSQGTFQDTKAIPLSISIKAMLSKKMTGGISYGFEYQEAKTSANDIFLTHQFRMDTEYALYKYINIKAYYSYYYRRSAITGAPVRDNKISIGANLRW